MIGPTIPTDMLFPIQAQAGDAERTAFVICETGEAVSFAQLDARANQVAQVLRQCGVGPGAHVALLMRRRARSSIEPRRAAVLRRRLKRWRRRCVVWWSGCVCTRTGWRRWSAPKVGRPGRANSR